MHGIQRSVLLIVLSSLLFSCAAARLPNQGNVKTPIEMKTYRVVLPDERSWKDWESSVAAENDSFTLRKLKIWPLNGQVQGVTTMIIVEDSIAPEGWPLSETEHADNVRAAEEKIMNEEGVKKGKYEIEDLSKGDTVRNGKKLYFMKWTASGQLVLATLNNRTSYVKGAMYLYFPEGYKDTHTFYRFLITDALFPPTFLSADIDQIYPLVDGFALKQQR